MPAARTSTTIEVAARRRAQRAAARSSGRFDRHGFRPTRDDATHLLAGSRWHRYDEGSCNTSRVARTDRMDQIAALSSLTARSVADLSPEAVVAAFAAAFAGYQVPIAMTAAQLDARLRGENLDPFASTIFYAADEPVAIVLITRRGTYSRVGAMGVAPSMRGTGLAAEVMHRAVSDARARGDNGLTLEVIQDNARAVKLYERAGFAIVRTLWGFSLEAVEPDARPMIEIDLSIGVEHAGRFGMVDLAWQQQLPSLAAMVRPTRCFTDDARSVVAMLDASQDTVRLKALCFDAGLTSEAAIAFTASLRSALPGRPWTAPPLYTDAHRERFFTPGGWTTMDLRQFEMRHPLAPT